MKPLPQLETRTLTGFVLVLTIILCLAAGLYGLLMLVLLINGLGLKEFYELAAKDANRPRIGLALTCSTMMLLLCFPPVSALLGGGRRLIIPIIYLVLLTELYHDDSVPFVRLAITGLGFVLLTLPLIALLSLPAMVSPGKSDTLPLLGYFSVLWANDTAAYIGGSALGRHPLFYRLSPGKTWEGSICGMVAALLVAWINVRFFPSLSAWQWGFISLIACISGTYGDLLKSMLKRSAGVKDSGSLLPGHGGILDRFDSLLGSAPFVYLILSLWS